MKTDLPQDTYYLVYTEEGNLVAAVTNKAGVEHTCLGKLTSAVLNNIAYGRTYPVVINEAGDIYILLRMTAEMIGVAGGIPETPEELLSVYANLDFLEVAGKYKKNWQRAIDSIGIVHTKFHTLQPLLVETPTREEIERVRGEKRKQKEEEAVQVPEEVVEVLKDEALEKLKINPPSGEKLKQLRGKLRQEKGVRDRVRMLLNIYLGQEELLKMRREVGQAGGLPDYAAILTELVEGLVEVLTVVRARLTKNVKENAEEAAKQIVEERLQKAIRERAGKNAEKMRTIRPDVAIHLAAKALENEIPPDFIGVEKENFFDFEAGEQGQSLADMLSGEEQESEDKEDG